MWLRSNRGAVERRFNGAILDAINAHGPVTKELRSSASKRVYRELMAMLRECETRTTFVETEEPYCFDL